MPMVVRDGQDSAGPLLCHTGQRYCVVPAREGSWAGEEDQTWNRHVR
jgi:hypothetical protein